MNPRKLMLKPSWQWVERTCGKCAYIARHAVEWNWCHDQCPFLILSPAKRSRYCRLFHRQKLRLSFHHFHRTRACLTAEARWRQRNPESLAKIP